MPIIAQCRQRTRAKGQGWRLNGHGTCGDNTTKTPQNTWPKTNRPPNIGQTISGQNNDTPVGQYGDCTFTPLACSCHNTDTVVHLTWQDGCNLQCSPHRARSSPLAWSMRPSGRQPGTQLRTATLQHTQSVIIITTQSGVGRGLLEVESYGRRQRRVA